MMLAGVGNFMILISGDKPMDLTLAPLSDDGIAERAFARGAMNKGLCAKYTPLKESKY